MAYHWQGIGSGLLHCSFPKKLDSFPLKWSLSQYRSGLLQTWNSYKEEWTYQVTLISHAWKKDWTRGKRQGECHSSDQDLEHRASLPGRPYFTRRLCNSEDINVLHMHGTVSGELLVLFYQQETRGTAAERSGPNLPRCTRFSPSRIKWKSPGWVVESD